MSDAGHVCFAWGTTDKSQWIHKLFHMYGSMGVLQLNPVDSFSWETFWLHEEKIKNKWRCRKMSKWFPKWKLNMFFKKWFQIGTL